MGKAEANKKNKDEYVFYSDTPLEDEGISSLNDL